MYDRTININERVKYNIYGSNGELLVGVGTPITENMLKHLNKRKWEFGEPSEYIYSNIALLTDELVSITTSNDLNIQKIIEQSKSIVDLVKNNPVIYRKLDTIEKYDRYTYIHSTQVAYLAVALGIKLNFDNEKLVDLCIAALLHDLGKCAIDINILNKVGKLTEKEMNIMKNHPKIGFNILKKHSSIDDRALNAILHHHENYDGSGYPHGLKMDEISLEASIIHVCDVFDALVSNRPYKHKYTELASMNIIKNGSGTLYDPSIVDLFSNCIRIYSVGSKIELSDGRIATIEDFIRDSNGDVLELKLNVQEHTKVYKKVIGM